MRIKRFESVSGEKNIFDDQSLLHELLLPLTKFGNGYKINYGLMGVQQNNLYPLEVKFNTAVSYKDSPMGNDIFSGDWIEDYASTPFVKVYYIYLENDYLVPLFRHPQRSGRLFCNFGNDFFEMIETIERIKYDCESEGYTVSVSFLTENPKVQTQIVLSIVEGKFK